MNQRQSNHPLQEVDLSRDLMICGGHEDAKSADADRDVGSVLVWQTGVKRTKEERS